ncbi:heterokaryon incompatibility protein-domain-containing protein [Xylogone sp. PMI_703]|nr:heterokaryon incompatibility protein-domain-containing protein [Xylogone sp. PMI_703]
MNTVLSPSTASDQTFLNISTWIRHCEAEHTRCTYLRSKVSWYPTRLLDVGTQGNTLIRLVHSGQSVGHGQSYMTLSHRWGASKVPTLSTKTIDAWGKGLSIQILPQTFQEFITLAHRLQVRYVWIDSLCIIQEGDAGSDWRSEALTMDQVYMNSYCNISADWGSEKRGLFFQRDLRMLDKPNVNLRVKKEPNWDSITIEERLLVESEFWEDSVSKSPLSNRGWVVQERWLSPRNIRFGPREVFFECSHHTLCERFPESLPQILREGDTILKAIFGESQMPNASPAIFEVVVPGTVLYNAWSDVLTKYSRCYLTFASDRLVAFAGIAKFFQAILNDRYIAGLWQRNLAYDMMWFRDDILTTAVIKDSKDHLCLFERNQADQYRAPSFSWASAEVPISPPNRLNSNFGFLVDVKCIKFRSGLNVPVEEMTEDIFGPMLSPTIEVIVVGSLRKMRLLPYFNSRETELYAAPGGPPAVFNKLEETKDIYRDAELAKLDFQISKDDITAWTSNTNLYYMPWQDNWDPRLPDSLERHKNFTCLLLELVDSSMSRFRRIGRMFGETKRLKDIYLAPQGDEAKLPCAHYDANTTQCTIYII